MPKFERALADALAEKERRHELMRNDKYRKDVDAIKEYINHNTGFRYVGLTVEKGDKTIIKLRAKERL